MALSPAPSVSWGRDAVPHPRGASRALAGGARRARGAARARGTPVRTGPRAGVGAGAPGAADATGRDAAPAFQARVRLRALLGLARPGGIPLGPDQRRDRFLGRDRDRT